MRNDHDSDHLEDRVNGQVVRNGGGGSGSALWRSICADVFNISVTLTNADHGAALGAALIAGASIGHFGDLAAVSATVVQAVKTVEPHPERAARYAEQYAVFRSLYPSLREQFHALGKILK